MTSVLGDCARQLAVLDLPALGAHLIGRGDVRPLAHPYDGRDGRWDALAAALDSAAALWQRVMEGDKQWVAVWAAQVQIAEVIRMELEEGAGHGR